jgi:hypothetical protein
VRAVEWLRGVLVYLKEKGIVIRIDSNKNRKFYNRQFNDVRDARVIYIRQERLE